MVLPQWRQCYPAAAHLTDKVFSVYTNPAVLTLVILSKSVTMSSNLYKIDFVPVIKKKKSRDFFFSDSS